MNQMLSRAGLSVDERMVRFIEDTALPGTGLDAAAFWSGLDAILTRFEPLNDALVAKRDALQSQIDDWHKANAGKPQDPAAYQAFLRV